MMTSSASSPPAARRGSEHIDWKRGMVRVLGKRGRDRMTGLGSRSLAALRLSVNGTPGAAWVTVDGSKPVSLETLYFIIRRLGQRAGVAAYPRRFRTTFASRIYTDSGGDFMATKLLMGHRRAATTERYIAWGAMEFALSQQRKFALGDRL